MSGAVVRTPVRLLLAVALVAVALLSSSCKLQLTAQQVKVTITKQGLRVTTPGDVHAGEVVFTVENYTGVKRQPVLLQTPLSLDRLPTDLRDDPATSNSSSVVMVGGIMKPAQAMISGFMPVTEPSVLRLHVYLHKGQSYLLFDTLGGDSERQSLQFAAT